MNVACFEDIKDNHIDMFGQVDWLLHDPIYVRQDRFHLKLSKTKIRWIYIGFVFIIITKCLLCCKLALHWSITMECSRFIILSQGPFCREVTLSNLPRTCTLSNCDKWRACMDKTTHAWQDMPLRDLNLGRVMKYHWP